MSCCIMYTLVKQSRNVRKKKQKSTLGFSLLVVENLIGNICCGLKVNLLNYEVNSGTIKSFKNSLCSYDDDYYI